MNDGMQRIKLELDGKWDFEELSDTARDYIQLYGFAYSLLKDLPLSRRSEIDYIYAKFPWRGGYSTVNFFNNLFHRIPADLRPRIQSIRFASPGFIELYELLAVAVVVAGIVKEVCSSINNAHDTYRQIQKASVDYKLSRIDLKKKELELTREQIKFSKEAGDELCKLFRLTNDQIELIDKRTQGNPVMKVKILLSVFRRVVPLADKQSEKKLKITGNKQPD